MIFMESWDLWKDFEVISSYYFFFVGMTTEKILHFFFLEKYMIVISSVQLRGHLFGHPIYVIERVSCLSFDSSKACQKLNNKKVRFQLCVCVCVTFYK